MRRLVAPNNVGNVRVLGGCGRRRAIVFARGYRTAQDQTLSHLASTRRTRPTAREHESEFLSSFKAGITKTSSIASEAPSLDDGPIASTSTSLPSPFLPLATPPPPSEAATPSMITEDDILLYMMPLYAVSWSIYIKPVWDEKKSKRKPQLARRYQFNSFEESMDFVEAMRGIIRTENNEPFIQIDGDTVHVHISTESVLCTIPSKPQTIRPGITLRDLRLAYLLESLYIQSTTASNRPVSTFKSKFPLYQPTTLAQFFAPSMIATSKPKVHKSYANPDLKPKEDPDFDDFDGKVFGEDEDGSGWEAEYRKLERRKRRGVGG